MKRTCVAHRPMPLPLWSGKFKKWWVSLYLQIYGVLKATHDSYLYIIYIYPYTLYHSISISYHINQQRFTAHCSPVWPKFHGIKMDPKMWRFLKCGHQNHPELVRSNVETNGLGYPKSSRRYQPYVQGWFSYLLSLILWCFFYLHTQAGQFARDSMLEGIPTILISSDCTKRLGKMQTHAHNGKLFIWIENSYPHKLIWPRKMMIM